jgi:hypothetical protein
MLHKSIDAITESDLQSLVIEGRREDARLEFKLTVPGGSDDEKREFLKDVSAMANSQGGDIIYGIREDRSSPEDAGKAAELVGITDAGADATKLWMFELLNSSIDERLIGVTIRDVQLSTGGFALVVRVPRSWSSPHVVRHKNHWRFYARNSAGVYAMNVTELRNAFLLSDTLTQRLEEVRMERLNAIIKSYPDLSVEKDWSTPGAEKTTGKRKSVLVIHLQPFDSVKPGYVLDVAQALNGEADNLRVAGEYMGSPSTRLNFDGVLVADTHGYVQVYRSGMTEEVDSGELTRPLEGNTEGVECIGATELDRAVFKGVGRRLALLKSLGVTSPVLVSVSLLGVKGCKLQIRRLFYIGDNPGGYQYPLSPHTVDRQNLFLTGLVIENLQELPIEGYTEGQFGRDYRSWRVAQGLLRPYCDAIWNSVGLLKTEYFDPEGKWLGHVYRGPRG